MIRLLSKGIPSLTWPSWVFQAFDVTQSSRSSFTNKVEEPNSTKRRKMRWTVVASSLNASRRFHRMGCAILPTEKSTVWADTEARCGRALAAAPVAVCHHHQCA